MIYIENFQEGQHIIGHYLCKDKQAMKTRAGKTYYNVLLMDKTGTAMGKIWDLTPQIGDFNRQDFIKIDANVTVFQGDIQLNISRVRRSEEGEYDPADYMQVTKKDPQEMFLQILTRIDEVQNPYLKRLLESYFVEDEAFVNKFMVHPAAKNVHHNFVGGLLEHVSTVMEICCYFGTLYSGVNRDLLIAGALFHDIGKMEELEPMPHNEYSDAGQLLGHIAIGYGMVRDRIRTIEGFPPELEQLLEHMILSHHGELEFGSPKVPSSMEAMILHLADNADAKMKMVEEFVGQDKSEGRWTAYNRLLARNFYKMEDETER